MHCRGRTSHNNPIYRHIGRTNVQNALSMSCNEIGSELYCLAYLSTLEGRPMQLFVCFRAYMIECYDSTIASPVAIPLLFGDILTPLIYTSWCAVMKYECLCELADAHRSYTLLIYVIDPIISLFCINFSQFLLVKK